MMFQLRQKLKSVISFQQCLTGFQKKPINIPFKPINNLTTQISYSFSQVQNDIDNKTSLQTNNNMIDFKSLTKKQITQELSYIVSEQLQPNKLNNIEQQAVSHLNLNKDDITNLILILQIMLKNNRQSAKVLEIAHKILLKYFESIREKKEEQNKQIQTFQQLIPLITQTDRFDYELIHRMYQFYNNSIICDQFTPVSQLHILNIFLQKGLLVQIPSNLSQVSLSFSQFVDLLWAKTLTSNTQIDESSLQQLSNYLFKEPSLKNIPKSIQYKLKEIQISQDLGESNKYIKQFDDFFVKESQSSLIQEDCEIILKVLKWNYKQESLIDPYTVDFVVNIPKFNKKIVLEMNGPSHYPYFTRKDILSGKDQMKIKNLLIKNYIPVTIHHQDWSEVKGVTGKMDFIKKSVDQAIKLYSS